MEGKKGGKEGRKKEKKTKEEYKNSNWKWIVGKMRKKEIRKEGNKETEEQTYEQRKNESTRVSSSRSLLYLRRRSCSGRSNKSVKTTSWSALFWAEGNRQAWKKGTKKKISRERRNHWWASTDKHEDAKFEIEILLSKSRVWGVLGLVFRRRCSSISRFPRLRTKPSPTRSSTWNPRPLPRQRPRLHPRPPWWRVTRETIGNHAASRGVIGLS